MSEQVINLAQLPPPEVIEEKDFQDILDEMLQELRDLDPELELRRTDPAYRVLEVCAYREYLMRQRSNDRIRSLLLAFAGNGDLDHIGVTRFAVQRQVIDEGDPDADPPVEPIYESDEDYRRRLLLARDGEPTAGSRQSYEFHALSADGQVRDVSVARRGEGVVLVTVLSRDGQGQASEDLLDTVRAALNEEKVRPLSDDPEVRSVEIKTYTVRARLELRGGPSADVVIPEAEKAVREYVDQRHALGREVIANAAQAAMFVEGVHRVHLDEPLEDILCDDSQAPYCESVEVSVDE